MTKTKTSSTQNLKESAIQSAILQMLRSRGIYCLKVHQIALSQKGTPDIIGCHCGKFIGLEVKTSTGSTTALQDREHLMITRSGGICRVVRSVDEAREVIEEVERQHAG